MIDEIQKPMPAPETASEIKPHVTSMAVWDVPLAVVPGSKFKIKVGVKCAAGCDLSGSVVDIFDEADTRRAAGKVGNTPLPSIEGLYWTEVELQAPSTEGPHNWTTKYSFSDAEPAHAKAVHSFAFRTIPPPEHVVTVRVTDKEKKTAVKNAKVILQPFSGITDENGIAKIGVTRGEYKLWIPKVGKHATFRTNVMVEGDIAIEAELVRAPVPEP